MIVRLASGLSYQNCSWQVVAHSLCVSTYVFGAQRSIYKKEEKDTPRAGSKLNNYFLRSSPLPITFSEVLIVQDYTTTTPQLFPNIVHNMPNLLR